ncbi:hypothetical protein E8E12_000555 [Didymella heteroderae]|uniref:Uncharacterized protein n=1 Tax=Didymella heteroderae TaxID=1769908 RepID=A0A9P4WNX6_9PLEO|nr:hypothetical protein E8E12_000555 [Didymella heteroderae]
MPKVSIESLIRKILEPFTAECILHDNVRACKWRIGGQKVQNYERTLQELIKPEIYAPNAKLLSLHKVLEWNRTDDIHESPMQFTWLATWKESLMLMLPLSTLLGRGTLASDSSNEPKASSKAQASSHVVHGSVDSAEDIFPQFARLAEFTSSIRPRQQHKR